MASTDNFAYKGGKGGGGRGRGEGVTEDTFGA